MKRLLTLLIVLTLVGMLCFVLSACIEHKHSGGTATCATKALCTECGESYGEPLPHDYEAATCTEPKSCKNCPYTVGDPLGHNYADKVCTRCNKDQLSIGLEYALNADGESYSVTGIGSCTDTAISINDNYEGLPVTGIGEYAFAGCTSLTDIRLPDTVKSIGNYVFSGCTSLTSIQIPDGVTSIGNGAFYNCYALTSIEIPEFVTYIGAFAFSGCYKLVEVINRSSLEILAGSEDYGFVAYYSFEVHNGETKTGNVDDYLFYTYDGVNYLLGYIGSDTELILPENYRGEMYEIYEYAFYRCHTFTDIVISEGVSGIGDYAFYDCYGITSIAIPESIADIGNEAFLGCKKLYEVINRSSLEIVVGSKEYGYLAYYAIEVHNNESKIDNLDNCLFYTYNGVNYLLRYMGNDTDLILPESYRGETYEIYDYAFYERHGLLSVVISEGVTGIGYEAFYRCLDLKNVVILEGVTNIGDRAFMECFSLKSIEISDSVTSIGNSVFRYCQTLTSIVIPNGVTAIGYKSFEDCRSLESIVIPESVTKIGDRAFAFCYNLSDVYYSGTENQWSRIRIVSNDLDSTCATIHYNCVLAGQ